MLDTPDDDLLETPEPRWECPTHEDVCSETGVTLSRYMMEMVRVNPDLEEIESSEWIKSMDVMAMSVFRSSQKYVLGTQYSHPCKLHARH